MITQTSAADDVPPATMRIGELARRAEIGVQTVRYYERRGLLNAPHRRPSGYREYGPSTLERLRFIRRAQELGFTLSEIAELLALRLDPHTTAADVKARAERKVRSVERKIRDLQRIQHALEHLAGRCRGEHGPAGDCPLLDALGPLGADEDPPHAPERGRDSRVTSVSIDHHV